MKLATNQADRPSPLLFDCCRCGPGRSMSCAACMRWARHHRMVTVRSRQFAKIGGR